MRQREDEASTCLAEPSRPRRAYRKTHSVPGRGDSILGCGIRKPLEVGRVPIVGLDHIHRGETLWLAATSLGAYEGKQLGEVGTRQWGRVLGFYCLVARRSLSLA
jgi:hypothetical protein